MPMSIEKMSLINIMGSMDSLDRVLELCCKTEMFHPEMAAGSTGEKGFHPVQEECFSYIEHPGCVQRLWKFVHGCGRFEGSRTKNLVRRD